MSGAGRLPRATTTGWGAELVLPRLVLPVADRCPDAVAVVDGPAGVRRTYAEHLDRVARLTAGLRALGVGPDDRYAALATNRAEYVELWHAAFFGGGVFNPLNARLAAPELHRIVADGGPRVAFVDDDHAELWDRVDAPGVAVVRIGAEYEDLLAASAPSWPAEPDEADAVVLMYTGGTTGTPKGVVLSHRAEVLNLQHQHLVLQPRDAPVYLHQSPMFHGAAIYGLLSPMTLGGSMVVAGRFDPAVVVDAVEEHGVTDTQMAPTMISMLLDSPAFEADRMKTLRRLMFGGMPMPLATLDRLRRELPELRLFQGYGMTEVASVATMFPDAQDDPARLASVGRPVPGVALEIRDPDGHRVPAGEVGEVCLRAGNLMSGYWQRPAETEEALRGGWYHTADAGYVDAEGYLFLVDRLKDMIITGGENVYSIEVEQVLATHPAVAQVAVVGVPDELWGERVHAVVVVRPGHDVDDEELRAHARKQLGGYKVPRSFELRTEPLPLSGAMKVVKDGLKVQSL